MKEYSAGGIITKNKKGSILVLLVEHLDGTFVFPKGHVENGETFEAAAKREIREEVGLEDIVIKEKLGVIRRRPIKDEGKLTKEIVMFRVEVRDYTQKPDSEEVYKWFELDDALLHLRYEEDRLFFQSILSSLK